MGKKIEYCLAAAFLTASANVQAQTAPNAQQVLMYSATMPSGAVPSIFTETAKSTVLGGSDFGTTVTTASNYTSNQNFVQMSNALNASIATALSIIPLSSPASGVIERKDPVTGADLAESSTLGPIFTERAETIGKGHFYIGFSNQDFHFTQYNGASLNGLSILYPGGQSSAVLASAGSSALTTSPASFNLGMDVRLSQNIAFLTYGLTDRLDVSVGLPVVHAAVAARTYSGQIYAGNGFATNGSDCWCVNTFTAGAPTIIEPQIGQSSYTKTGFGDLLVRVKGTVYRKPHLVIGLGGDLRLPTGDAQDYLGVGTTTVKPFVAVSFYSQPLSHGIVLSPHFDVGWQFSGKSALGGVLTASQLSQSAAYGPPFTSSKGFLPDVFTWAGGVELALGRRSTVVADILGNQIGWIHGIPNTTTETLSGLLAPTGVNGDSTGAAVPSKVSATGLVSAGNVSFGQYNASFGYKVKLAGNLLANLNVLVRLDDNGLVARVVPLFGLGYSF
jgi:hypothetical protein